MGRKGCNKNNRSNSSRHKHRGEPDTMVVSISGKKRRVPWWFVNDLAQRLEEQNCFCIDLVEYLQITHDQWRTERIEVEPDSFGIQYTREELEAQDHLYPGTDEEIPF